MGTYVIKPLHDRDEYVYWSDNVEAPLFYGDRAEMLEHIGRHADGHAANDPELRMQRADRNGSSSLTGFYHWDDAGPIYEQRGVLPRAHLFRAAQLIDQDREPEVWDLMVPFEDETEVRRG